jgi:hypothetical protein
LSRPWLNSILLLALALHGPQACASPASLNWEGDIDKHVKSYHASFDRFRELICVPKAESIFSGLLKSYRGQGYWIPEYQGDVDVVTIKKLLPELEKKLQWISAQREKVQKSAFPAPGLTGEARRLMRRLLELKKTELLSEEKPKVSARQESLKKISELQRAYARLIERLPFLTNYRFPVDHLKNRKQHEIHREKSDPASVRAANEAFLLRKILEDGTYTAAHTAPDTFFRTTLDTIHHELQLHDFYLSEDARYDLEFALARMETELKKGKASALERLTEWEQRTRKARDFYLSLTLPENQLEVEVDGKKTSANRELIREHNRANEELKDFVYRKQAEVYQYWLKQPELTRAIFVLETILLNEVGGVDGDEALERMDVARVVMNRLDKPKYLSIGEKEFIYPHLRNAVSDFPLKNETWLNALFKQGEFSFTYYYMSAVSNVFCPDVTPSAKKLRRQNVELALRVLKEGPISFKATRYFSRASMVGRIHMDTIWEDYLPYPERPGLIAKGQDELRRAFARGDYSYLYSFQDPAFQLFQVVEINGKNYAMGEDKGLKLFYQHRNPHYFRYFTKIEIPAAASSP